MAPHLTHVALFVRDSERTVDFYQRFAGLHVVHERVDDGVRVPHMAHFGYDVESRAAVEEIAARADVEGLLVQGPMDAGPIVGYFCMLRDPDGNLVEFSHGQPINPRAVPGRR